MADSTSPAFDKQAYQSAETEKGGPGRGGNSFAGMPSNAFFLTPGLQKRLQLSEYLMRFSAKLVVITAPQGAGKTAFLEQLRCGQRNRDYVCAPRVSETDTPQTLLAGIAREVGLVPAPGADAAALMEQIRRFAQTQLETGRNCLVFVDDAHRLTPAQLTMLLRLAETDQLERPVIRVLLSGQSEILAQIQTLLPPEVFRKRLFHQSLPPLSAGQLPAFLQHLLDMNEDAVFSVFSETQCRELLSESHGWPGRVKTLATQKVENFQRQTPGPSLMWPGRKRIAVLASLSLLAGAFYWWSASQAPEPEYKALELSGQVERLVRREISSQAPALPGPVSVGSDKPPSEATPVEKSPLSEGMTADSASAEAPPEKVNADPSELGESGQAADTEATTAPESVAAQGKAEPHDAAPVTSELPALPETPGKEMQREAPVKPGSFAARVLALPASQYTLQLAGSRDEKSLRALAQQLPQEAPLYYFETRHQGAPWYVLIYGHYIDRVSAKAAINELPAPLRRFKPWIRQIAAVQEAVRTGSGDAG